MMVYWILNYHADRYGEHSFPSLTTISKEARTSRQGVVNSIKKLVEYGYINKEQRKRKDGSLTSNLYTILIQRGVVNDRYGGSQSQVQELYPFNNINNNNKDKIGKEKAVVVLDFHSVLKKYREHNLSFTEKTIRQHYKICGPEKITDCLRVFEKADPNKIDKTPEAYFTGILKNYVLGTEVTPGHIVQEQETKKNLNDLKTTGEKIKKNKLTPKETQNLIASIKG